MAPRIWPPRHDWIDSCDLSRPCLKEGCPLADATASFGGYDRLVSEYMES
jgi:hypothetical protein